MEVNFFELARMSASDRKKLSRRRGLDLSALVAKVAPIIDAVRTRGDDAVREFTRTFDGADLEPSRFRVRPEDLEEALNGLPLDLRQAMDVSIENIRKFHERQREIPSWEMEIGPGIVAGEKVVPIPSVGLYVPRGKGVFSFHDDDGWGSGQSRRGRTDSRRDTA